MQRIALFLLTNIGVMIVLSISMRMLGLESFFTANYGLNLGNLLVLDMKAVDSWQIHAIAVAMLLLAICQAPIRYWKNARKPDVGQDNRHNYEVIHYATR